MTPGRAQLLAVLQRHTGREVARQVGVSAMTVSRWSAGRAVPTRYQHRMKLFHVYGINPDGWEPRNAGVSNADPRVGNESNPNTCVMVDP